MMRVGDRHRERVGGIGSGDLHAGQKAGDHRVDLRLLGGTIAHHRFLDQPSRIFADVDASPGRAHQHDSARLAELQRRLRILVHEHFFHGGTRRAALRDQSVELISEDA